MNVQWIMSVVMRLLSHVYTSLMLVVAGVVEFKGLLGVLRRAFGKSSYNWVIIL